MRVSKTLCDICLDAEVDERQPGEIRLKGHCDAKEPDRVDTFESLEICPRCIRSLFECIGRLRPAIRPGSSKLLQSVKNRL